MEFKLVNETLIGFRDDGGEEVMLGQFVEAKQGGDDGLNFYFRPAPNQLFSCRDCRKAAEKLSELNGRAVPGAKPQE